MRIFFPVTPNNLRRQILQNKSKCATTVHSLVRGGAAPGSVSSGVGVVSVSGAGGPEGPTPPSTTETNQTPPGVGSGGEGVASLPSDPPPGETAETNQAPGGERGASSPSDPPPEETAETNQAPGGGVASPPSDPPAPESETNKTDTPPTQGASETILLKIQEDVREIKKMLEARIEVETALVALVRDLEPISSVARNVERLIVDVDEAKVIRNPLSD